MATRSARKIQNGVDSVSSDARRDEIDRRCRVSLVAVRIQAQILIAEPLLEPVGRLRCSRVSAWTLSHDHLWYGSPRTIVPAR